MCEDREESWVASRRHTRYYAASTRDDDVYAPEVSRSYLRMRQRRDVVRC